MKDVHAAPPREGQLELREVGITEVRKPISVQRPDRVVTLSASFSVVVDLPADRKGSDLSRNAEVLAEIVDDTAQHPVPSLEAACARIARELLARHPYATESIVTATADYFRSRAVSGGRAALEDYRLFAEARGSRRGATRVEVRCTIGGEAVGMTACPCAMENIREELERKFPDLARPGLSALPMITHNQRTRTRLSFELPESEDVEADALLDTIEAAQSSPTYAILKRGDEARVVIRAHEHPKFAEDVLRDLLASLPARFPRLSDAVGVHAKTVSEESIHKYNVVAEHRTTVGELRSRPTA